MVRRDERLRLDERETARLLEIVPARDVRRRGWTVCCWTSAGLAVLLLATLVAAAWLLRDRPPLRGLLEAMTPYLRRARAHAENLWQWAQTLPEQLEGVWQMLLAAVT
mgnify:CR=1 FL=1